LPTLGERAAYEICAVCWWEDDGQDDAHADEIWGGPNKGYSLTSARKNYAAHGHMYAVGDGNDAVKFPSDAHVRLLQYLRGGTVDKEILGKLLSDPEVSGSKRARP